MATDSGFNRPSLQTILARLRADLNGQLRAGDARVPRTMPYVIATVLSGTVHLIYGAIAFLARQLFPDTATGTYLVRHAKWRGVQAKVATTATDGAAAFTGTAGAVVPSGTQWQRQDGVLYVTTAPVTLDGSGNGNAPIVCTKVGAAGNVALGVQLTAVSPVTAVTSTATVSTEATLGTDDEPTEDLRARLLAWMAAPPQGGSFADWQRWPKDTPGVAVRNVWVTPWGAGPGTMVVRFSVNGTGAGQIPSGGQVSAVHAYLDTVRPAQSILTVVAPTPQPVTFDLHVEPDTSDVRAAVEAALQQLLADAAGPDVTIPNSVIRNAIADADGETSHVVVAINGGDPLAPLVGAAGALPYLDTVNWS